MEFKVVISDPETGKSYNRIIKDVEAQKLIGKKIGEEIDGNFLGLIGYKLRITGGSDKSGFPMKKGVHKPVERVLISKGSGYRAKKKVRKRKRVRGETISSDITQVNTVITKKGTKNIEEIFGISKQEEKQKEVKQNKQEDKKPTEKPKDEK
ncbi:MAG: 30S ribosomal protein S6e [Candidatus Altiarchaeota archaeon]